jgi:hypothetical protein
LLDHGEAGHGLALRVVGGALGEVGLLVVLVALGLADGQRHGQGQAAEEVFQVGGVLAGGVDADVEVGLGVLPAQLLQALLQGLVAGPAFQDGHRLGGRLAVGAQERDAVAVAGGIATDVDTVQGTNGGHGRSPATKEGRQPARPAGTCVAREPVSLLREIFGPAILVISGPRRLMYQSLSPKPEGTIFSQRSTPEGTDRAPHDATTIMTGG